MRVSKAALGLVFVLVEVEEEGLPPGVGES